jgi:GNAT superfamily N-acetyltransferase
MRWMMERTHQQAQAHPHSGKREIHAWTMAGMDGKQQILEQNGFTQFRYGFMMRRPLSEPIPELDMPEGLHVRAVEKRDMPALFWGLDEAFRDHFGHAASTSTDLDRFLGDPLKKPELYQVAWDTRTGEIAGGVLNNIYHEDNVRLGVKRGWTDPIFVRRPWRKRGLASALIVRSMRLFKAVGMDEAYLGVDALNPNGALKIYEGLGFIVDQRSFRWKRDLQ